MGARISQFFGGNNYISDDFVDLERGLTPRVELSVPTVESPIVQERKKMRTQGRLSKKEQIFARILKYQHGINYNDIPQDERAELRKQVSEYSKQAKYLSRGENSGKIPTPQDYFYAGLNFGGKTKRKKRRMKYTKKKK